MMRIYRARELISWQAGAIGLLALAVLVNMGMMSRIASLEEAAEVDAARYRVQIERAEHTWDLAVRELGAMRLRQASIA